MAHDVDDGAEAAEALERLVLALPHVLVPVRALLHARSLGNVEDDVTTECGSHANRLRERRGVCVHLE